VRAEAARLRAEAARLRVENTSLNEAASVAARLRRSQESLLATAEIWKRVAEEERAAELEAKGQARIFAVEGPRTASAKAVAPVPVAKRSFVQRLMGP
jgi:hypothetical protein